MNKSAPNTPLVLIDRLYVEAQQWARHYEALLVNTNVFIVTISLAFLGIAFSDKVAGVVRSLAMMVPIVLCIVGLALVWTLFTLYAQCVERLIRYERAMGCFDEEVGNGLDGAGSLLPLELSKLPVKRPPSVHFFNWTYLILLAVFLTLMVWSLF
jgi:hypothetical protein